ncbi:MAG TPA: CopG family transcriptional regulator [Solirubrobacteraceae bacterium]|nr:CopG family transcriptional regulator [Solirubrobacteraceae bacterium]
MQRTTLSLPDDVAAALKREAQRRRQPVSKVAREAIERHLELGRGLPFVGLGRSDGSESIAENDEAILAREWSQWIDHRGS